MAQYLSDLKVISSDLEEPFNMAFQNLGITCDDVQELELAQDELQRILTELKRDTLSHDVNPLIGAATFLFIRLFQLEQLRYRVEVHLLQKELISKIKCFTYYAKEVGYQSNEVMAACYLLCAWIDEYLDASPMGKEKSWIKEGLLKIFQFDASGDSFFLVLKRCMDNAKAQIDLLELIYLCLCFGFKGPYRYQAEGQRDLSIITDHLYHHIRSIRGDFSKSLLIGVGGGVRLALNKAKSKFRILFLPFLISIFASLSFIVLNHQLGERLLPIFQKLSRLVA